jgi:hypothetical protein
MIGQHERFGDLDIDHDMKFVRRSWMVQRIGRIVWLLLIIAAMLGAFGHGWLASDRAVTANGKLSVEYERIAHVQAPIRMQINVAAGTSTESEFRLWIDRGYLDDGILRMISPEPVHMETSGERIIYAFRSFGPSQDAHITIDIETEKFGRKDFEFGLVDGPELEVTQLILP